jgi:hypothetical protein
MEFGYFKNLNSTIIWKDSCDVNNICIFDRNIPCINGDCSVSSNMISNTDRDVKIYSVFKGTDSLGIFLK